jgi:serine phosphatase RsbU (regulator of sigma subunit)
MLLTGSAIVVGIILLREASLLKAKRELENLVELRTIEITRKNVEISNQAESLRQANEEIKTTYDVLAEQNKNLQELNEEITVQRNELEEQRNSLANLAWELQEKNEEITSQRNEIQKQKDMLAQQQKEITDSIMYAKRIQQAILPTLEQVGDCFNEFFIFYRPKSIVSGDFYWTSRIGKYRVIAVVDCTGHGVPGGFMSMLGLMMLNEVISQRQILDPAQALNYLRQNIISVLHQKGEITDAGDGMDLSLCIIDDEDMNLYYSGANSSIILMQPDDSGNYIINDIISDRMPISYHLVMRSFSTQKIKLKKGTLIYLYSDGISDQFSGENGKKFQILRLRDFILDNYLLPLKTQGMALEQLFDAWKGDMFQVDDVLVMGVKV